MLHMDFISRKTIQLSQTLASWLIFLRLIIIQQFNYFFNMFIVWLNTFNCLFQVSVYGFKISANGIAPAILTRIKNASKVMPKAFMRVWLLLALSYIAFVIFSLFMCVLDINAKKNYKIIKFIKTSSKKQSFSLQDTHTKEIIFRLNSDTNPKKLYYKL